MLRSAKRYFLFVPLWLLVVLSAAAAETVKVGIPSLTVTMLPLAVAKERGYFQQEGLSVDLVLMPAALNIKVLLGGGARLCHHGGLRGRGRSARNRHPRGDVLCRSPDP